MPEPDADLTDFEGLLRETHPERAAKGANPVQTLNVSRAHLLGQVL